MKNAYFLILVLFLSFDLFAQSSDSVTVVFDISNEMNEKIEGARVSASQGFVTQEARSNQFGKAIFDIERFGDLIVQFRHPDYSTLTIIEEIYSNSQVDTLRYSVIMTSMSTLNLDEVVVTVPGVPEVVFSSKELSVQDFEIIDQNNVVLLTYPKQLKKGSRLLLFDMNNSVKDSIDIEGEALELVRDYVGRIYLLFKDNCKRLIVNENSLETIDLSLYHFKRYLQPIIGTFKNKMFFSTYDQYHPAFDYYYYDVVDSTYTKIASIIDHEMMVEYRAEYRHSNHTRGKLAAKNQELLTGVDAEIIFGRKYFSNSIYYTAPFAPMFLQGKNLFLFDYHCDSLKVFSDEGELVFKKFITHDQDERKNGWEKLLLQDRVKNEIYTTFEKGGYYFLRSVNLISGELNEPIKLNQRYAETVQVFDGFVYYIYRPFESYQKKYFWREKLPND